ncbi:hypothetical protein I2494_20075 [Budviciaceae bacterium BWR-B9]|uniref:Fumarase D n=1 Tax=Limnobaculum allomyrinae TaxID=2791986 RepID=A0ABS1IW30_9GAMM|nr:MULTISPECIES: hypothetical protein [Limnobaculum]MBK5145970.1 hypothetical protein [Limnobaculum allomyrinae]MBV7693975.1 hypothetical protein [Limnobaculum sp. M2-1]
MAFDMNAEINKAMGLVGEIFNRELSPRAYNVLCEAALIVGISALREREGDEFVRGFLEAAIQDLDKPIQFSISPPRRQ